MMIKAWLFLPVIILLLVGCKTSSNKDQFDTSQFGPHGYIDDTGKGEAGFRGNRFTKQNTVEQETIKHTVKLCRDKGYKWFAVTADTGVKPFTYMQDARRADLPEYKNSEFTGRTRPVKTYTGYSRKIFFKARVDPPPADKADRYQPVD